MVLQALVMAIDMWCSNAMMHGSPHPSGALQPFSIIVMGVD